KADFSDRLIFLGKEIDSLIKKWQPETLAIEKLIFNKNQKTAGGELEAREAIMYICALRGLKIQEFTHIEIKTTITSYGRADKKQVQDMVLRLIKTKEKIKQDDEIDAIAVALTSIARRSL